MELRLFQTHCGVTGTLIEVDEETRHWKSLSMQGENELKIKDAIKENKECFEDLFDTIIPWEENFVAVDNLRYSGTLIEVDEETPALEELEYARFRIRVTRENELKIKDAIKENKECFEDLFDTIIPWEENFVAVDNLVWVRCRGLPPKLWNYDCFKHIAALSGTLIEVDEETRHWKSLSMQGLELELRWDAKRRLLAI
ncbi:hypothetical protein ACSQ67_025953 [Phaseolus vulgaris]